MGKILNFVTGDKGGIGKSTFSIRCAEYLREKGQRYTGIDSDNANATFKRYFKEDTNFHTIDISNLRNFDAIIEHFQETDMILLDTRAASFDLFKKWKDEVNLFDVISDPELNIQINFIPIVTPSKDTVAKLKEMVNEIGNKVNWIVVKNKYLGENFDIYDNSKTRTAILELGAVEIDMPNMAPELRDQLEKENMLLHEAIKSEKVKILDKQRYKNYAKAMTDELDKIEFVLTGKDL